MTNQGVEQVLRLAGFGWLLFPVKSRENQPLIADWPNQATSDEARLRLWHNRYPDCNWGVATGPESGIFVLDADGEQGLQSLDDLEHGGCALPSTLITHTGRGAHIYLQ